MTASTTTVHKLVLEPGRTVYGLPMGAVVLSAREQGDTVCLWYRCDPTRTTVDMRTFHVFATGQPIPSYFFERLQFIGTAHLNGGALVFHVFEESP